MAAPKKRGDRNDNRPNGKAWKHAVWVFDATKRRLVKEPHPKS